MDTVVGNNSKSTISTESKLDHFESNLFIGDEIIVDGSIYRGYSAIINSSNDAFSFISKLITSDHMKRNKFQHFHSAYSTGNVIIDTHEDKGSINIKNILKRNSINNTVVCRFFGKNHIYNKRWESISLATTSVLKKMGFLQPKENNNQNKEVQSENNNLNSDLKNENAPIPQSIDKNKDENFIPIVSQKSKRTGSYHQASIIPFGHRQ